MHLRVGVVGTARKENERRVPLHPRHLELVAEQMRDNIALEVGYGRDFGVGDERLEALGFGLAPRAEIVGASDLVVLPKPLPRDLLEMRDGAMLWGWPHCVQQPEITQAAIDKRLTLIAFEAMFAWGRSGERLLHTFSRNNELAGYCSVLHALELLGWDGVYGPPRTAVVLGFGSVGRGAVYALHGRGFMPTTVLTQRPPHLVHDRLPRCRFGRMLRGSPGTGMTALLGDARQALVELLADAEIVVNATLQDTDAPLMYLLPGEESRLRPGTVIIDVSCDEGMGFEFARPTSFDDPIFRVGPGGRVAVYAVDHSPTYLWEAASWEISAALLPFLETVMAGPETWAQNPTISRAVEISGGVIQNRKILSFQQRSPEYPHLASK